MNIGKTVATSGKASLDLKLTRLSAGGLFDWCAAKAKAATPQHEHCCAYSRSGWTSSGSAQRLDLWAAFMQGGLDVKCGYDFKTELGDSVRIYFAPITGAIRGIREELTRIEADKRHLRFLLVQDEQQTVHPQGV